MAGTTTSSTRSNPRSSLDTTDLLIQFNKLVDDLETVRSRIVSTVLSTAGLAIKAGGQAIVKAGTAFRYLVPAAGVTTAAPTYGLVAANTDWAALAGTVTNAKFNVYVFSIKDDGAGAQTKKTTMGTEGATRAAIVFPVIPADEAVVGFVEVNPTGTGNFVGGTTALDDATVVPNAVYVNTPYPVPFGRTGGAASGLTAGKVGDRAGTAIT